MPVVILQALVTAGQVIGGILSILAAIRGLMTLWGMIKKTK